jgi:carboxymethylenebutenolidase
VCFDADSRPPIRVAPDGAVRGAAMFLQTRDGNRFRAFAVDAPSPTGAAVVVLPDVRGLHRYYEELALRFAEAGVDAVAIDPFGRTAGTEERAADFESMPHVERTTYAGLVADTQAAADDLRRRRDVGALFAVGFCFGGRLAFLTATHPELGLAGAVGFYGVLVGPSRNDMPAPVDVAHGSVCPVLGLFGGADPAIPAAAIAAYEAALSDAGVDHELVTYPDAPHSFFDRKAHEHAAASQDAWERVIAFVRARTPSEER